MRNNQNTNLDWESLCLFQALCETHNLGKAALKLGIPQATVSRMLSRLRKIFDDELFTRCAGGLSPTAKALALESKVNRLLAEYESLFEEETFDPVSLVREFRIACADHALFFVEPAVSAISKECPGVTFKLVANDEDWPKKLHSGDLDFVIFPFPQTPEGCRSLPLSHCDTVMLVRKNHPLEILAKNHRLTLDECLDWKYILIRAQPESGLKPLEIGLPEAWQNRMITVKTPYFFSAAQMVKNSDLVFTCSRTLAQEVSNDEDFAILELPVECMHGFTPRLIWHERSHTDPALQWLRSMIVAHGQI